MEAHCFSGESGTIVLHLMFFNPFSSAHLAVVIWVGEEKNYMGVRLAQEGRGKGKHGGTSDSLVMVIREINSQCSS